MLVAFHAAHIPLDDPPETLVSLPPPATDADRVDRIVEALDTEIGRLIDGLAPATLDRTTLFVLSDNGTAEHGIRAPWDPARSKGTVFDGGARVPFIVAGPRVDQPGSTSEALVHIVDVFPTVAEIAGIDPRALTDDEGGPVEIDGESLLPFLQDPDRSGRPYLYTDRFAPNGPPPYDDEGLMIRDATHKLRRSNGRDELYAYVDEFDEGPDLLGAGRLSDDDADALARLRRELDAQTARLGGDR